MRIIPKTVLTATVALALATAGAGVASAGDGVGGSLGGNIPPMGQLRPVAHSAPHHSTRHVTHRTRRVVHHAGRPAHGHRYQVWADHQSLYQLERGQGYGRHSADRLARHLVADIYPSWLRPGGGGINRHVTGYVWVTA